MSDTFLKVIDADGGERQVAAFNNGAQIIPANVPTDAAGNPLHLLEADVSNRFMVVADIVPTTLTVGSNFLTLRNPSLTKKIKITRIETMQVFTGTAAASRSAFKLRAFSGCTSVTGTMTVIVPSRRILSGSSSVLEARVSATAIGLAGATTDGDGFAIVQSMNQSGVVGEKDFEYLAAPITLGFQDGICVQAQSVLVAGVSLAVSVQYYEV